MGFHDVKRPPEPGGRFFVAGGNRLMIGNEGGEEMFNWLVNEEGGLTTAGYGVSIAIMVVCLLAAFYLAGRASGKRGMGTKQLAYCAMALALSFVTSYIKPLEMPYGGSVTLMSMLFIVLVGNWYGVKTGVLVGFAYGMLQFLQEPYVLSVFQVCCDYLRRWAWRASSGDGKMAFCGAISWRCWPGARSIPWAATSIGWTTCRKTSPSPSGPSTPSSIITAICWPRGC